jgi:hypothetical protein
MVKSMKQPVPTAKSTVNPVFFLVEAGNQANR